MMEALGRMISVVVSGGLLSSFFVETEVDIFHLLFDDDNLIFCGPTDPNHLRNLRSLLCFVASVTFEDELSQVEIGSYGKCFYCSWAGLLFGCGVASLPLKYLGVPLGASYKAKYGTMMLRR